MRHTLLYGFLIGFITLFAFISVPLSELLRLGGDVTYQTILSQFENEAILMKSQTFAFTALAVCELIHAVGMRNVKKSFIRKDFFANKLMIFSLVFGIFLQVLVTEVPFLNEFFKTTQLTFMEWCYILGMACIVLIAHEILVIIHKIKKRKNSVDENV